MNFPPDIGPKWPERGFFQCKGEWVFVHTLNKGENFRSQPETPIKLAAAELSREEIVKYPMNNE